MNDQVKQSVRTPAPQSEQGVQVHQPSKLQTFTALLDARTEMFKTALPQNIDVGFFKSVILTAVQTTKELLDCSPASIWAAARRAAHDGLLPDGRDGVIIVRWNYDKTTKKTVKEAGWQPMIGGVRKKVRNSGEIEFFTAEVVHENDQFEYAKGDESYIRHHPALNNRGYIVGAYSIAKLKSGEMIRDVMGIQELHEIRDKYSEGWKAFKAGKIKSTPWADAEGEMCKKTVALRLSKVLPMSTDVRETINYSDDTPPLERVPLAPPAPRPKLSDFTHDEETGEIVDGHIEKEEQQQTDVKSAENGKKEPAAAAAQTSTKQQSAQDQPKTEIKSEAKPEPHAAQVASLKARLEKYPRELQNQIWDAEVEPNLASFTTEEIETLQGLLKVDEE